MSIPTEAEKNFYRECLDMANNFEARNETRGDTASGAATVLQKLRNYLTSKGIQVDVNNSFSIWGETFQIELEYTFDNTTPFRGALVTYRLKDDDGKTKKIEVAVQYFDRLGNTPPFNEDFSKIHLGTILKHIKDNIKRIPLRD